MSNSITAIITGDIVNSRKVKPKIWLPVLEKAIAKYTSKLDIYRGDSFQLEVEIEKVFEAIFYIKASIKALKHIDVRMAIGIGKKDFKNKSIKKSNGEAFVSSGEAFENLKKETLTIKTPWPESTEIVKLLLEMSSQIADNWNENIANSVKTAIENPGKSQKELAEILNKKYQGQVSTELTRAGYHRIVKTIEYCTNNIVTWAKDVEK
jgi:aspartate carbamoyltransferase catalytic subunit